MTNFGYACVNLTLAADGVFTNKGMVKRTYEQKGIQYASQLALQNVQSLVKVLDWNLRHGISVFRVTSELFPWASQYKIKNLPDFRAIRQCLEQAGSKGIRITMHPDHFNKLAGSGWTLENTFANLELHSEIMDLMQLEVTRWHKINIHVGGAYGDKTDTLKRFAENYGKLSVNLQKRLTVENDDKKGLFTTADLLPLHELTGISIVFDYFHHKLNPGDQTEEEAFNLAFDTWNVKPVFHYSSSRKENEDSKAKKEAHADYIYERINTYGKEIDLVVEAKMKELAIIRYRQQFGANDL